MSEEELLNKLDQTLLKEQLIEIKDMYNKLAEKQAKFCSAFDIHCLNGCGKCCEHFVPDVTKLESLYLAYGLIAEGVENEVLAAIDHWKKDAKYCPLYNFNSDYHCTVYKWRPLICRLFGASASKNKNGDPSFRHCKYNLNGKSLSPTELKAKQDALCIMSDFGEMLEDYEDNDNETYMIYEILPESINKIKYILSLEEESKNS